MEKLKQINRKCKRFSARLKTSKGVLCVETPTTNIVLCNVGQATGFIKEDANKLLEELPTVNLLKYIAEKGESHSFLVFADIKSSQLFYEAQNGKAKAMNGTVIYMNYVEGVPSDEILCTADPPKGLQIIPDFITIEEEKEFIALFDWIDEFNLKNRQVKHYGYEFRYGSNDVDLNAPLDEKIPLQCDILWERLRAQGIAINVPDQLTVNKYLPGQGIPSHVDRHSPFGETILSLSLGSDVVMDWKHHSNKYVPIVVPARSMLVMQEEARYDWQHAIQPRTWDPIVETRKHERVITGDTRPRGTRISLTFRKTREGPCKCCYNILCDRFNNNGEIDNVLASHLEELHVHQVYEQIAGHFSTTRHKRWPRVDEFLQSVPSGAVLLDLGAGNGKNILNRNDILQIAGERSAGLLLECSAHTRAISGSDCVRLDLLHSPLRDECADVIICIAVIHHFCSEARRKQSILTIARLLRPGGVALITVWAKDQTKSNYLDTNKENRDTDLVTTIGGVNFPIHENRTQFQHSDLLVPWKLRQIRDKKLTNTSDTFLRYYHVFEDGELDDLCKPELEIENSFYEEGNWCVVCKKL
ncbi:alkylated DNA repair protein alkB homolog 8 [Pieris rapae]|uniref:alkylated DNA repair protein alkB homolog 8 n=1 Tax=Pieris rapae TaxID=64459 RepID=UPI001E27F49F|nr:alkylated DNA repair protein alkB homolog 8 [Pieris rapae]